MIIEFGQPGQGIGILDFGSSGTNRPTVRGCVHVSDAARTSVSTSDQARISMATSSFARTTVSVSDEAC